MSSNKRRNKSAREEVATKKSGKEYGSNGRANAAKSGKNGFAQRLKEKKDSGGELGKGKLDRIADPSKSVFVFRLVRGLTNSYNTPFVPDTNLA